VNEDGAARVTRREHCLWSGNKRCCTTAAANAGRSWAGNGEKRWSGGWHVADRTWMGQLWIWMGKHDVRVRLRGGSATSNNSSPFVVDHGFRGETRAEVAEGCGRAGVVHKSDLYMRDGKCALCTGAGRRAPGARTRLAGLATGVGL
jgi:hypothetical protein